jgi:hypothetical protein
MKGIYAVKVEECIRISIMTAELANLLQTNPGACALDNDPCNFKLMRR